MRRPSLSPQSLRMLRLLEDNPQGVHSHDLRAVYKIGDPGRRRCDLVEAGYDVRSKVSRRGRAHGVIYTLAHPLQRTAASGGTTVGGASAPSLSARAATPPLPERIDVAEVGYRRPAEGYEFVYDYITRHPDNVPRHYWRRPPERLFGDDQAKARPRHPLTDREAA